MYEQTVYIFKSINPEKKYSKFSYTLLSFKSVTCAYCNKDEIVYINGTFYLYSGEINNYWTEKHPPIIRFKNRNKIIKEIPA
jgi:hypothetical protein